jgi:hypothetical protein
MTKEQFLKLCEKPNKKTLQKAINNGFNLNQAFSDGTYPLFMAIEKCEFFLAKWCVELGAKTDILDSNGCSLLVKCYEVQDGPYLSYEFVQVGIKPFINPLTINAVGEYGISALIYAIYWAQPKEVKLLLDNGANVNEIITLTKNYNCHRSALFLASFPEESVNTKLESKNGTKVVKELIKYKPNPNIQDKKVDSVFPLATPLMKACFERNYAIAKEILKLKNIDWQLKDDEGYSTFTFVCKTNQADLILKAYQHAKKKVNFEEVINSVYYQDMTGETKSLIEKLQLEQNINKKEKTIMKKHPKI